MIAALILGNLLTVHAYAQDAGSGPPPLSRRSAERLLNDPALLQQTQPNWAPGSPEVTPSGTVTPAAPSTHATPQGTPQAGPPLGGGTWTAGTTPSGNPVLMNPILMADGTVIAHTSCTSAWYKLTPDNSGNYATGTWTQIASLPANYQPRFFSSALLPDGRVIVEGGEYNNAQINCNLNNAGVWTKLGAIYDPVANTWTAVTPPSGWAQIGDAEATVLANGTYLQSDCCDSPFNAALFNPTTLTWTATGTGKADSYDEEGWTLLPSGKVLTVDASLCNKGSEIYDPATGGWSSAGNTVVQLPDCSNPGNSASFEMGPHVLRPDGSVVAFAGTTCSDSANTNCKNGANGFIVTSRTAIFNLGNSTWAQGPNLPVVSGTTGCPATCNYTLADAPAALEPNGSILFAASPNYQAFAGPVHFFELGPAPANTIIQVADPSATASSSFTSYEYNFLVLPTGQIMAVQTDGPNVFYYNPIGSPNSAWAPTISSVPTNLVVGQTYTIAGTQLNGLSQGAYYGDDVQGATNFPLVRVTDQNGKVAFYKTTNSSTYSVASGTASTASFTVPPSVAAGPAMLQVVSNGIASQPVSLTLFTQSSFTLSTSTVGSGTVTSAPSGISCGSTCSANFAAGTQVILTATPGTNSIFTGWSGGGCSGTGTCSVTMIAAQSVIANFAQATFSLSLTGSGSGTGQVTSSPAGINCSPACVANFTAGSVVTLTASAANGSTFAGWSGGGCSGTGTCSVTMSAAQSVIATFNQIPIFMLSVTPSGGGTGTVTSNPSGINCGATCTAGYQSGTQVTVTATPGANSIFTGWSGGGCSGTGTCTVTMSAAQSVIANFAQATFLLNLTESGSGTGQVTSSPAGINCSPASNQCAASFAAASMVTLTASAANGSTFAGWSGGGCSGTGTCSVTMSAAQSVVATFTQIPSFMLSVTPSGGGTGTVTSNPSGINCGATCTASYQSGTQITLTAAAASGSTFSGWSGGGCSGVTCVVTLTGNTTVTPSFIQDTTTNIVLAAALLPLSRSVQVGATATAFATIINAGPGDASACSIASAGSVPASFVFQTTDPSTNALTGTANTPANIAQGKFQTFVIALTPSAPFAPTDAAFTFACANASPATSLTGINTLNLSASTTPVPDIVALAASGDPGYVDIPGATGTGVFAVATVNVGNAGQITASANTGMANLPVTLSVCQTDPETGACLAPPAATVTTSIAANATPTFGIFVSGSAAVSDLPGVNRVFVTFADAGAVLRGETSVAVRTQ